MITGDGRREENSKAAIKILGEAKLEGVNKKLRENLKGYKDDQVVIFPKM